MSARRELLNAIPSVFWSLICVTPLYLYCSRFVPVAMLITFLLAGTAAMFLPGSLLQRTQLSSDPRTYSRLRIPILLRLTQDAAWLRRLGKSESRVRRGSARLTKVVRETWVRERFHIGCLVFYTLCLLLALCQRQWKWFVVLAAANVVYNLYPIWLQQYLRLRLLRLRRDL